jgi:hypothetical protein
MGIFFSFLIGKDQLILLIFLMKGESLGYFSKLVPFIQIRPSKNERERHTETQRKSEIEKEKHKKAREEKREKDP